MMPSCRRFPSSHLAGRLYCLWANADLFEFDHETPDWGPGLAIIDRHRLGGRIEQRLQADQQSRPKERREESEAEERLRTYFFPDLLGSLLPDRVSQQPFRLI
jgi:hypothetical protein